MSPRRAVEKELTKDQILAVARVLFSSRGFEQVTMRDIAKQLGYSHGSIYYHFKNKNDLFIELLKQDFDLLDQTLDRIASQEHDLRDILLAYIEFGLTNPHHYEMMFMTKERTFLSHPAPTESYKRFVQEVSKFSVALSDIYFLFLALHGFVSYHLRFALSYEDLQVAAEKHVEFLLKR